MIGRPEIRAAVYILPVYQFGVFMIIPLNHENCQSRRELRKY